MSVKGWGALTKKIVRIAKDVQNAPQRAAKAWIEEDFKPYAQSIAPVRTGAFRDSIDGRTSPTSVTVFAAAPHARWVEEGTSTKAAQPTVAPAVAVTLPNLRQRIKDEVKKVTK